MVFRSLQGGKWQAGSGSLSACAGERLGMPGAVGFWQSLGARAGDGGPVFLGGVLRVEGHVGRREAAVRCCWRAVEGRERGAAWPGRLAGPARAVRGFDLGALAAGAGRVRQQWVP